MEIIKEFYFRKLLESPRDTGDFDSVYSDTEQAKIMYSDVLNDPEYKKVYTLFEGSKPIYLYLKKEENDRLLYFIPENDDFIYGYATYEHLDDGGIEMYSVYNRGMYHGLAKLVYEKYLIPNHVYMMSNSEHSKSGKNFWRSLVISNMKTRHVTIWDVKTRTDIRQIENVSDLDDYYSSNENYERYRIRIYR